MPDQTRAARDAARLVLLCLFLTGPLVLPSCQMARRDLTWTSKSAIGLRALTSTETMTLDCPADRQQTAVLFDARVVEGTVHVKLTDPSGKVRWETTTGTPIADERSYRAIAGTWTFEIGMAAFTGDYRAELNAHSEHDR